MPCTKNPLMVTKGQAEALRILIEERINKDCDHVDMTYFSRLIGALNAIADYQKEHGIPLYSEADRDRVYTQFLGRVTRAPHDKIQ